MDRWLLSLFLVFFIAFAAFTGLVVFNKPISRLTRASEEYTTLSQENSRVIVWPTKVKADGVDEATVDVFLVSVKGPPILNKKVALQTSVGQVKEGELAGVSGDKKHYTFHLVSSTPGLTKVQVLVDGVPTLSAPTSIDFTD